MRASFKVIVCAAPVWAAAAVCLLPAMRHIAALVHVLATRVPYAMDIEWMENGQLYEAYRFLHGLPIYGAPDQGFVPFPYPPGYFVTVAAVGALTQLDWWTARAVSDFFLALIVGVQAVELWRHVRPRYIALSLSVIAAAGIAVGYPTVQGSYDLARPDVESLGLACLAATLMTTKRAGTWGRVLVIAFALFAAIYTKQSSVFFAVWIFAFAFVRDLRTGLTLAFATGLLCGAVLAALAWRTDGWFVRWMTSMQSHPVIRLKTVAALALTRETAPLFPWFPMATFVLWRLRWLRPRTVLWLGMFAAALPASLMTYAYVGGWVNCLIPMFVLAWFVSAMLAGDAIRGLARRGWLAVVAHGSILLAAYSYFRLVAWDPAPFLVDDKRQRDAEAFHAFVRTFDGALAIPAVPFAPARDGKATPQISLIAYYDASQDGHGIPCDPMAGLASTGAEWVLLTGVPFEEPTADNVPGFARVRVVDLEFAPMVEGAWRRKTLWRRSPLVAGVAGE